MSGCVCSAAGQVVHDLQDFIRSRDRVEFLRWKKERTREREREEHGVHQQDHGAVRFFFFISKLNIRVKEHREEI